MQNKSIWHLTSMTGFGKYSEYVDNFQISITIKSVNHKNLDIKLKLPPFLSHFESDIVKIISNKVKRGRIDCELDLQLLEHKMLFNHQVISSSLKQFEELSKEYPTVKKEISFSDLLLIPDALLSIEQLEPKTTIIHNIFNKLAQSCDALLESRRNEGVLLETVLKDLLYEIDTTIDDIKKSSKNNTQNRFLVLKTKFEELFKDYQIDDNRLYQEAALLAQRSDFKEEIDRLKAHVAHFDLVCSNNDSKGRKLDFICQEMLRETNTLLSKAFFNEEIKSGIELKSSVEKLREQIQNIE